MTRRVTLSIRTRLTLMLALVTTLVLVLGLALVLTSRIQLIRQEMTRHALLQAQLLGQNCITPLDFGYVSDAEEALRKIEANPEVEGASVFDADGKHFATFGKVGSLRPLPGGPQEQVVFEEAFHAVLVPISHRDRVFGSLLLQTSTSRLKAQIADSKHRFMIFSLLMGALSLGLAHLFQKSITRPILDLGSMARQVAEKNDYSLRMKSLRRDELGVLFDDFNLMLERIQAQNTALRESEAWSRRLIEITAQGFWHLDVAGRTVDCNQAHADLLGRERAEIVGRSALDFVHESARPQAIKELSKRPHQEKRSYDLLLERKDGTPIPVHVNATNLRGEDGLLLGSFAMITDLTERVRAEEMRLARDAAEAAALSKSEFLANMSHEIRTPMNAVLGFVGLALRQDLTPKVRDYLEKVAASGQSLLGIINDILDFSKIEAGKLELETTPFRLSDVLKQVGDLFSHRAAEAGLDFSVSMGAAVPDGLVGDPLRLGQVLINLTGNALKFTKAGHVQVRVEHLRQVGEEVHLWFYVQDTGIGMTEEQRTRLFQAFSQADSSTTRQFGGTGLGLSIAQRLVEKMGGEIVVLSQPDMGSTFAFSACFTLDPNLAPRPHRAQDLLRGKRVLVVDDSPVVREVLVEQLWSFDMEARAVASGEAALAALKAEPFDVVLMDWRMPGMDGMETSQRIRAQAAPLPPPAIIMVTAYGREDVIHQAEAAGFSGFLVKPISPSLLMLTLLDALPAEQGSKAFSPMKVSVAPKGPSLLGFRVLVVDDNAINLEVARDLLATEGIVVEVTQSGPEAIRLVEQKAFHAVFLDIQMPGMDGYETTQRIRANPARAGLPIIAMTAHALPHYRDLCAASGMNDFITKPIEPEHLFAVLRRWVYPGHEQSTHEQRQDLISDSGRSLNPSGTPEATAGGGASVTDPTGALANALVDAGVAKDPASGVVVDQRSFDVPAGLRRLRGSTAFYLRLVGTFAKDFAQADQEIRQAMEVGDLAKAEHLAHTLKGVAGNLSAVALAHATAPLETALRARNLEEAREALPVFEAALAQALASAPKLAETLEPAPVPTPASDGRPVEALLQELETRLSQGDPRAEDTWKELSTALPGPAFEGPLRELGAGLESFDFKAAAAALKGLQEVLIKLNEGGV